MDRTLIDCEPAVLIYDGATINFKSGITLKVQDSVQPTPSDIVENAGDTWDDMLLKISGTPDGQWESLTKLFPYPAFRRGQNIFGVDKTAVIHTTSGRIFTVASAAVTKCPDISAAPDKTLFGGLELTGVRKNNTSWATAGSLYTEGASVFASWEAFDETAILKVPFVAAWGALGAPWNGIVTEEGWTISFGLNLRWITDAAIGSVQAAYRGETVMAKCRSLNVTATDIIAAHPIQGAGTRRGKRIASGNNLVLTGDGGSPVITLTSAQLREPGYQFGEEQIRNGELGWHAQRIFTAGVPQPLYTLA